MPQLHQLKVATYGINILAMYMSHTSRNVLRVNLYKGWWKATATDLTSWSSAVQKVILVQPSSAAPESVFFISVFVTMFGDQQHDALKNTIEAVLMLSTND